jgi:hypothetical protein
VYLVGGKQLRAGHVQPKLPGNGFTRFLCVPGQHGDGLAHKIEEQYVEQSRYHALAAEVKRFGIRVNSVVPGLIEGGVGAGVPDALRKDFIAHCAVGRAGKAREVAEAICFLASDKSSYINGQNINVDGGV